MRQFLVLAAAVLAVSPAAAQFRAGGVAPAPRLPRIDSRMPAADPHREARDIRARIDDGRRAGQLSRREARGLKRGAWQHDVLADRYAQGGVSDAERREMETRAIVLRQQVDATRAPVTR